MMSGMATDKYTEQYLSRNELAQDDEVTVSAKKAQAVTKREAKSRPVYPPDLKGGFIQRVQKQVGAGMPKKCYTHGATFSSAVRWCEGEIATQGIANANFKDQTARSWIKDFEAHGDEWLKKGRGRTANFDAKDVKKIKSLLAAARAGAKTVSHAMTAAAMNSYWVIKCPQSLANNNGGIGVKISTTMVRRVLDLCGYKLYAPTTTRTMSAELICEKAPKFYAQLKNRGHIDPRLFDNMDESFMLICAPGQGTGKHQRTLHDEQMAGSIKVGEFKQGFPISVTTSADGEVLIIQMICGDQ